MLGIIPYLNEFKKKRVKPVIGSVVYCDLLFNYASHSGLYIGNNQIIHLNGKGRIEIVSPEKFISRTTAYFINVSCKGTQAVGSKAAANRAKKKLNTSRNYNLLFDNCHQFVAGCLTGDFDNNANNFLWILEMTTEDELGSNSWLPWDT
ncbi:hypothetical protein MTF64_12700 [Pseudoalteromonas sp. 2CM41L]|uniref:lecithin retinol acyltransferase family protein n=1 Tax=Pseudoalteromonas sp. 2CM41L TaxID=2929857 RepID=UPI0020BDC859|nr:lecithin retinol acyltransferase family protein [Pseudoalteromonas sp. 2CM41L]MCK8107736.1 hypothetical protein [Pseudoalteromonas sp. 2CM41L]